MFSKIFFKTIFSESFSNFVQNRFFQNFVQKFNIEWGPGVQHFATLNAKFF